MERSILWSIDYKHYKEILSIVSDVINDNLDSIGLHSSDVCLWGYGRKLDYLNRWILFNLEERYFPHIFILQNPAYVDDVVMELLNNTLNDYKHIIPDVRPLFSINEVFTLLDYGGGVYLLDGN